MRNWTQVGNVTQGEEPPGSCACPLRLRLVRPLLRATPPVVRFVTAAGLRAPGDFYRAQAIGCPVGEEA